MSSTNRSNLPILLAAQFDTATATNFSTGTIRHNGTLEIITMDQGDVNQAVIHAVKLSRSILVCLPLPYRKLPQYNKTFATYYHR